MKTTTCKLCKGAGRISAKGYNCKTVCTACSSVGKITTADPSELTGQNDSKPQEPTPTHPDLHLAY